MCWVKNPATGLKTHTDTCLIFKELQPIYALITIVEQNLPAFRTQNRRYRSNIGSRWQLIDLKPRMKEILYSRYCTNYVQWSWHSLKKSKIFYTHTWKQHIPIQNHFHQNCTTPEILLGNIDLFPCDAFVRPYGSARFRGERHTQR